jgi:Nodulation protein Z (NodZ)
LANTLVINAFDAGFFANFNNVASVLGTSLGRNGAIAARIDWTVLKRMTHFTYGEAGVNVWNRFFEPLSFDEVPAGEAGTKIFPDYSITDIYAYRLYKRDQTWRARYHDVFRRYIRPLPHVTDRVDEIWHRDGLATGPVVGVHARHPGHSIENIFAIPPVQTFIAQARLLLAEYPGARLFLATDTAAIATAFEQAFGDRLVQQTGVERATGAGQLHHGASASEDRGLQVLVDALLLARCDAMLHVTSNIATAVGYINPAVRMHFCETTAQAYVGNALAGSMRVRAVAKTIRAIRRWRHGVR